MFNYVNENYHIGKGSVRHAGLQIVSISTKLSQEDFLKSEIQLKFLCDKFSTCFSFEKSWKLNYFVYFEGFWAFHFLSWQLVLQFFFSLLFTSGKLKSLRYLLLVRVTKSSDRFFYKQVVSIEFLSISGFSFSEMLLGCYGIRKCDNFLLLFCVCRPKFMRSTFMRRCLEN